MLHESFIKKGTSTAAVLLLVIAGCSDPAQSPITSTSSSVSSSSGAGGAGGGSSTGGEGGMGGMSSGTPLLFSMGGMNMEFGKDVTVDAAGNIYVTGYIASPTDVDPGPGAKTLTAMAPDLMLAKYAPNGELLWAFSLPTVGVDMPHTIRVDTLNRLTVVGFFSGTIDFDPTMATSMRTSVGGRDAFLAQYDTEGNFRWAHTFGGTGNDEVADVAFDSNGRVYVTGQVTGLVDLDPGPGTFNIDPTGPAMQPVDSFAAVYDTEGQFVRGYRFEAGTDTSDAGYAIAAREDGSFAVAGTFRGTFDCDPGSSATTLEQPANIDVFIAWFDAAGSFESCRQVGGAGFDLIPPGGLDFDKNGFLVATGRFQQTVDFDPGSGMASRQSKGGDDIFTAVYDTNSQLSWLLTAGGAGNDSGHRARFASNGELVIGGWFRNEMMMGPDTKLTAAGSNGNASDMLIARFTPTGTLRWATHFGSGSVDEDAAVANNTLLAGMSVDAKGRTVFTGRVFGTANVATTLGPVVLSSNGSGDLVLGRIEENGDFSAK